LLILEVVVGVRQDEHEQVYVAMAVKRPEVGFAFVFQLQVDDQMGVVEVDQPRVQER
jgi:hypothetical protein